MPALAPLPNLKTFKKGAHIYLETVDKSRALRMIDNPPDADTPRR
jgi:hypothetical protein